MAAKVRSEVPLGRMGRKWDIAMAAVFLASPAASYVSGDTLVVDGAAWMYRTPLVPRQMVAQASKSVEARSRNLTGHVQQGGSSSSSSRVVSKL
jgi:peroxisomal 2,4-dienoyl-CoA reductase